VVVWLLREGFTASHIGLLSVGVSERSCYRLIASDRQAGGQEYRRLPRGRRPRRRVCRYRRGPIPNRRDISERPVEANERSRLGHWEGDLVEGRGAASYLLVLRERKSRLCRIQKLADKRSDTVAAALIYQLKPFAGTFRSLTLDNGGEFADHQRVAEALGCPRSVFFARPYRACDKGSLEQLNGLVRRRYPKGTDFRPVPQTALDALRDHLNVCPLKVAGGKAPIHFIDQLRP
jgi:IS30 family transposase